MWRTAELFWCDGGAKFEKIEKLSKMDIMDGRNFFSFRIYLWNINLGIMGQDSSWFRKWKLIFEILTLSKFDKCAWSALLSMSLSIIMISFTEIQQGKNVWFRVVFKILKLLEKKFKSFWLISIVSNATDIFVFLAQIFLRINFSNHPNEKFINLKVVSSTESSQEKNLRIFIVNRHKFFFISRWIWSKPWIFDTVLQTFCL